MKKIKFGSRTLALLPEPLQWSLHNLIAHPVGEIVYLSYIATNRLLGRGERLYRFQNWLHEITIPQHEEGKGRG
tara:strand:- start:219 stop:440 length:222 start_codon:yes stop_codon:yes gene_type:complete